MKSRQIVSAITSRASALRLAAEIVQSSNLIGCCAAFSNLRQHVYDDSASSSYQMTQKRLDHISDAQNLFRREMTEVDHSQNPYRYDTYWMGPLDAKGRKRRVNALLMVAETL